jgi:hypothetical protein
MSPTHVGCRAQRRIAAGAGAVAAILSAAQTHATPPWNIRWFGCDVGSCNCFCLQRDGTPVCGSGNCGGPPGSCWGAPVTAQSYNAGCISWMVDPNGSLHLSQCNDYQVYGDTFLYVNSPTTIAFTLSADVGELWLDGTVLGGCMSGLPGALVLSRGSHHLEWTSYNQNQGTHFNLDAPFISSVLRMNSRPICAADFDNSGAVDVHDIFAFIAAWFAGDFATDFNGNGVLEVQDIFDFLNAWFVGC